MKQLFHFIYGDKVFIDKKSKIIPKDEIYSMINNQQVLEKLEKEKKRIEDQREKERNEEKEYRQGVVKECEKSKECAIREGFMAGMQKWSQAILEVEKFKNDIKKQFEKNLSSLALNVAKRIVGDQVESNPEIITSIVKQNLKTIVQCSKVIIYVNPTHVNVLEKNRQTLKAVLENVEMFSIMSQKDLNKGDCMIETEMGMIDAKLNNLWNTLEEVFEKFCFEEGFLKVHDDDGDQNLSEQQKGGGEGGSIDDNDESSGDAKEENSDGNEEEDSDE